MWLAGYDYGITCVYAFMMHIVYSDNTVTLLAVTARLHLSLVVTNRFKQLKMTRCVAQWMMVPLKHQQLAECLGRVSIDQLCCQLLHWWLPCVPEQA